MLYYKLPTFLNQIQVETLANSLTNLCKLGKLKKKSFILFLTDNAANVLSAMKESNVANNKHLPCAIHTMHSK